MSHRPLRRRLALGVLVIATGTSLTFASTLPANAAKTPSDSDGGAFSASESRLDALQNLKVAGPVRDSDGEVSAYVQFSGQGAFGSTQSNAVRQGKQKPAKKVAEVKKIRASITAKAKSAAKSADADVLYQTTNTIPGVALTGDADKIRALASRSDVVKITGIVPKNPENAGSAIDSGALASWQKLDQTGEGVTIAVLDTGVDYTHAGFGGPGTAEAYKKAQASPTLPKANTRLLDNKKFIGGWDLVGDDYDANSNNPTYQPIPKPDPNPLDCSTAGHGSHVAGTAAGYGVTADGKTFRGDYSKLTAEQVKAMRVAPGSAPKASLVGIRVFGCVGSSSVVGQALDYVLDPNSDGDFSDRAQVVNMSLGSDATPTQDPENDIVDALTKQGILSVVSSGNASDVTDVGGSPGNSRSSLTVANTVSSLASVDETKVTAPADLAGSYGSQLSSNFPWTGPVTGDVVMVNGDASVTGCSAITDPAVKGKWVWLHWTDDPTGVSLPCGSAARFNNAKAAGATGVVLDSPSDLFNAGIAGNTTIPGVQLTKTSAAKLQGAAKAGTLKVSVDPAQRGKVIAETGAKDTMNVSSSRGVHGSNGVSKPDVGAAGTSVGSVAVASGNGASVKTGTSMAAPHVAGIAALVAASGNYTPYQVKSLIMNTAATDVKRDGVAFGPHRVGSGRVMADAALKTPVYAYDKTAPDLTTSVFGVVEAAKGTTKLSRTIELRNVTTKARTYNVGYLAATSMPGAKVTVDKKKVTVPSKGLATVKVTLTLKSAQMEKSMDKTMDANQLGFARTYLADVTGRVEFTSAGGSASQADPTLRVPVTAAPKPVSDMSAKNVKVNLSKKTATVGLAGRGVDQGSGAENFLSKASTLTLGHSSARLGEKTDTVPSARPMDLQYVGANSTAPSVGAANGRLDIGLSTWGNWSSLTGTASGNTNQLQADIDVNGDGKADFRSFTTAADDLDLTLVATVNVATGEQVELQPLNGVFGDIDSNTYDTNVAVLPVSLKALGVTAENSSKLRYRVVTWSDYNKNDSGQTVSVDNTPWISYDPFKPSVQVQSPGTMVTDLPGQRLSVKFADTAQQLLVLHHLNATGDLSGKTAGQDGGKAEVVSFR
ncbi:S8 family peptidase [Galactobacter caseinivorans]|uniref:Subtilase n=1 Tax=Galactobacter caseinivorans TaxID=2676123 RepID=A0A496PHD7_9MICC|nr:S8 family serine peptidase [Galactobacter caseinivorans]RKW69901.1 subtilase [Galactobacter caseinivorans]